MATFSLFQQRTALKVHLSSDGVAPVSADATLLQEAIPRPVRKKFPLIPVLVGVLALGLLTGMVIERDPLMKLVGIKTSDSTVAPNTGGSQKASPTVSVTVSAPPIVVVTGQIPNVTCTSAPDAQKAIEQAGFKFSGSFVPNTSYANGTVFKTSPPAGVAPLGSEVIAFVATGPAPSGRRVINPCLLILQTLNPGILQLATPDSDALIKMPLWAARSSVALSDTLIGPKN